MRRTYYHNEQQQLFNHSASALLIAAKAFVSLVVYSPLFLIGFAISSFIWNTENQIVLLFLFTGIFALFLFGLVYFLKGLLIAYRQRKSSWWLLLWVLCIGITCIFPVWLLQEPIRFIAVRLSASNTGLVAQGLSFALGLFVYSKYLFHKDKCPSIAEPLYRMGKDLIS